MRMRDVVDVRVLGREYKGTGRRRQARRVLPLPLLKQRNGLNHSERRHKQRNEEDDGNDRDDSRARGPVIRGRLHRGVRQRLGEW